ncbi:hypothetical protein NX059_003384 [Plenodomus lindquistii]|nr:hypothetical protein NX059_003384 [Plenodomus lindquistii]
MPLLRNLTTKIKTAISPSSSPTSSPTSPETSSFQVVSGRKEGSITVKRPNETPIRMDSFTEGDDKELAKPRSGSSSDGEGSFAERKQRRISRFREELGVGDE